MLKLGKERQEIMKNSKKTKSTARKKIEKGKKETLSAVKVNWLTKFTIKK